MSYYRDQFEQRLIAIDEHYYAGRITAERRKELITAAHKWLRLAEEGYWDEQASRQEVRDGCA